MPHLVKVGFIHCARNIPPSKAMPSDSWQRLIVRRIVIGPVLSVGGGFFFCRRLRLHAFYGFVCHLAISWPLTALFINVSDQAIGDGERKRLLTRPMPFEPLPASVLFAIGLVLVLVIAAWDQRNLEMLSLSPRRLLNTTRRLQRR